MEVNLLPEKGINLSKWLISAVKKYVESQLRKKLNKCSRNLRMIYYMLTISVFVFANLHWGHSFHWFLEWKQRGETVRNIDVREVTLHIE